jgi:protein gp37
MAELSKIEWTTHTFNPWWGCTKVSDGCKFCYAEAIARRYGNDVWGAKKTRRTFGEKHWQQPVKWNAAAEKSGIRAQVFCASMADVFDPAAPAGERERLWEVVRQTPFLDWQLLTKRPEKIERNLPQDWGQGYANVWLGTSVEDERVIGRVSTLAAIPAAVHFLSCEPLIGPLENLPLENIQWVIVGGESGPRARPMARAWVNSIRAQCQEAKVPFFFKQWGGVRKKETGRILNRTTYDALPQPNHQRKIERASGNG